MRLRCGWDMRNTDGVVGDVVGGHDNNKHRRQLCTMVFRQKQENIDVNVQNGKHWQSPLERYYEI